MASRPAWWRRISCWTTTGVATLTLHLHCMDCTLKAHHMSACFWVQQLSVLPVGPGRGRYVADVLAEGRVARAAAGGDAARLLFKKRMFRETDEAISEPIFISLSFVQAQHDYLQVRFPEAKADDWRMLPRCRAKVVSQSRCMLLLQRRMWRISAM